MFTISKGFAVISATKNLQLPFIEDIFASGRTRFLEWVVSENQVVWYPWGTDESRVPHFVKDSMPATRQRILFQGPDGCAWYLGERVTVQSMWSCRPCVPKIPSRTMLRDYEFLNKDEEQEALNGSSVDNWVEATADYAKYIDEFVIYRHYPNMKEKVNGIASLSICHMCSHSYVETISVNATIPRQPWSIRLPSFKNANESKLVRIPQGQESPDLPLPIEVTHVTAEDATHLLQHIARLHALLFSTCLEAASELTELGNKNMQEERSKTKHDHAGKGKAPLLEWEDDEEEDDGDDEEEKEDAEEEEEEDQEDEEEEDQEDEEEEEGEDKNEQDDGLSDLREDSDQASIDIDTMENRTLKQLKLKTNKSVHSSGAQRQKNK